MGGRKYPKDWMMLPIWSIQNVDRWRKSHERAFCAQVEEPLTGMRGLRKKRTGAARVKRAIAQARSVVHGP